MLGIGSVIDGRYEVESLIGEGGMGVVMRARHRFTGATVALKMLHSHLRMRSDLAARFLVEARAPAAIGHPGIVSVLDGGVTPEGDPYFAMELLTGEPLHALMRREMLPFETARHICLQILDALGAAHAAGFIHRDLKPENVFVQQPSGAVKLLDFGITKTLSEVGEQASTRTGATMGTLLYMSPEQLRNAKRVDQRTDLWAVGVMLRQMLAGELPFRAESLGDMLVLVLSQPPRPLSYDLCEVPVELETLMARALAADPGQRFGSAQEMAQAIAALPSLTLRLARGAPGWHPPPPAVPPTMTAAPVAPTAVPAPAATVTQSRRPIWLALLFAAGAAGAIVALVALFGVGGWWAFSRQVGSRAPGCERACAAMRGCGLPVPQEECVTGCQSDPRQGECFAAAGTDCNSVGACYVETTCQAKPQGTATCAETQACEASCEVRDVACACRCLRAAAPDAAAGIVILNACVLRHCETECVGEAAARTECNRCAASRCVQEITSCTGSAPSKQPSSSEKPVPEKPKPTLKPKPPAPAPAPAPAAPGNAEPMP